VIDVVFLRGGDSGGEKVAVEEIFSPSSFLPLAAFLPGFFPTFLTYLQASTPRCRNRISRTRPGFWGCTGEDASISFKLDVPPLTNALYVTAYYDHVRIITESEDDLTGTNGLYLGETGSPLSPLL